MANIQVQFKVKAEIKTVTVDFFNEDHSFINHLKRCALAQIRGSVQKNTILNLTNNGIFKVLKDGVVIYSADSKKDVESINSTYNENSGLSTVYLKDSDVDHVVTYSISNIDSVCEGLDKLQQHSDILHLRLQHLLTVEQDVLSNKLVHS